MIPMNSRNPLINVVRTGFQSSEDDSEYLRTSRRDAPSLSMLTFSHSLDPKRTEGKTVESA